MPVLRTSKFLSARVAAGLPARERGLRRGRRIASWMAAALAGCWLLWQQGSGNDRVYHAGSISDAHRFIADDCAQCHQAAWQPLRRMITLDNRVTSTPDAACITCHAGPPHNEHPAAAMSHCAHCHREHHGEAALAAVDNRFCTACHANLPGSSTVPLNFVSRIASFEDHPEFAIHRTETPPRKSVDGPRAVADFDADAEPPRWRDAAALRFNHQKHLHPGDPRGLPTPEAGFERLACGDCHQAEGDGRYMRPIAYERHCLRCHPLRYDAALELGEALPHRDLQLVRATLRARLADAFQAAQTASAGSGTSDPSPSRAIPGTPPPAAIRPGELEWVNERLAAAEHVVFGQEAKGGCRFCHTLEVRDSRLGVVPPAIPDRWQRQARFNHASHRLLDCAACHEQAGNSATTADILLPRIATCRQCHGAEATQSGSAGDRCAQCHDYHDHQHDTLAGKLGLDLRPMAGEEEAPP